MSQPKERPDYLSEKEVAEVQRFLNNEVMVEAVRKVLLSPLYRDGLLQKGKKADPLRNFMLGFFSNPQVKMMPSDEKGKFVEAILQGVSLVETGFEVLQTLKEVEQPKEAKTNKAR